MTSDERGNHEKAGLFGSERAVSPVIGVILMVAITVILAAVIGTFVLGLGQNVGEKTPQASMELSATPTGNLVEISHDGGDALHADRTKITFTVAGSDITYDSASTDNDPLTVGDTASFDVGNTTAPTGAWTDYGASTGDQTFDSGDVIEIQLIDTQTQRVIFETEVTA